MITHCDGSSVEGVRTVVTRGRLGRQVVQECWSWWRCWACTKNRCRRANVYGELRTGINNNRPRPDPAAAVLADQTWVSIVDKLKPLFLTSNEKEYAKTRLETVRQRRNKQLKSFNLGFKGLAEFAFPAAGPRTPAQHLEIIKCYIRDLAKDRIARQLVARNAQTIEVALTYINYLLTQEEAYNRLGRGEASTSRAEVSAITENQSEVVSKLDQLTLNMKTWKYIDLPI